MVVFFCSVPRHDRKSDEYIMGPWDFLQGTPSSSEYRGLPWHHANAKHSLPGDVQVMLRQSDVKEKPWKSESIIRKEVWFDKRLTCFCQNIKPL